MNSKDKKKVEEMLYDKMQEHKDVWHKGRDLFYLFLGLIIISLVVACVISFQITSLPKTMNPCEAGLMNYTNVVVSYGDVHYVTERNDTMFPHGCYEEADWLGRIKFGNSGRCNPSNWSQKGLCDIICNEPVEWQDVCPSQLQLLVKP